MLVLQIKYIFSDDQDESWNVSVNMCQIKSYVQVICVVREPFFDNTELNCIWSRSRVYFLQMFY